MKNLKLFIMSFWIFFVLLIIVTLKFPVCLGADCQFIGFKALFTVRNIVAFSSFICLLLGLLFYYQFMKDLKGDLDIPVKIEKIENVNYEYFALLVTIISLIAFDFTTIRGVILLITLLVILCAIFIKTELFYSNPSFALLGFHIYKADTNNEALKNKIFITKDKIKLGDKVKYLKISDKVYFTKKA
nr:anti-phage protein KwaA [uncultured Carboxylicivirga sp.]